MAALGMKNSDGTYVGFWGAMSNESRSFRPWTHQFTRGSFVITATAQGILPSTTK